MVNRVLISLSLIFVALAAEAQTTFPARVRLNLCPEYRFGGVTVELKYTLGADTTLRDLTVTSQTVDTNAGTGIFNVLLPNSYGATQLNLQAFCRHTTRGLSDASNSLATSNCAAIALRDTDSDTLTDDREDSNCDNFFTSGDASNMFNIDSDADGVRDRAEVDAGTDPRDPGSSPTPIVFAGAPFDPDGNGNSNPVVFRRASGTWFIKDYQTNGNALSFSFGLSGDIPFTYVPRNENADVGTIREQNDVLLWFFHGSGFSRSNGAAETLISFGNYGDAIILGPWEEADMTTPAIAHVVGNQWHFLFYGRDGVVRSRFFGTAADIPRVGDYDGDGFFDIAVFRPSTGQTLVSQSTNGLTKTYTFGSANSNLVMRGDVTGDGIDDISVWDTATSTFKSLKSDTSFATQQQVALGNSTTDFPIAWNKQGSKIVYTVVNYATGVRSFRANNVSGGAITSFQWGLAGDAHG